MNNYAKRLKRISLWLSMFVTGLFAMESCTEVNDELGMGFIPEDQQMMVSISSVGKIETFQTLPDSVLSEGLSYNALGSVQSPTFGSTVAGIVFQASVPTFENNSRFGSFPKEDSLVMNLYVSGISGDTTTSQRFLIYEVKPEANLYPDTTYYANYQVDTVIETDPLFAFTHTGGRHIRAAVDVLPAGEAYLQRLMRADSATYATDSMFHLQFHGFYITPEANQNVAMYRIDMTTSYMELFSRSYRDYAHTIVLDTVNVKYEFDNSGYRFNNASINVVQHDYTGSAVVGINDTLPGTAPLNKVYVQNMAGVVPCLRFTDEFVAAVEALKTQNGITYSDIVINQALFRIKLADPSIDVMNAAPTRLGMYYRFSDDKIVIPDYAYEYESEGNTLPYGGYLYRIPGEYRMDMTVYVQDLLRKPDTPRNVYMGATVGSEFSFGEATLLGSESPGAVEIQLTYTLIR